MKNVIFLRVGFQGFEKGVDSTPTLSFGGGVFDPLMDMDPGYVQCLNSPDQHNRCGVSRTVRAAWMYSGGVYHLWLPVLGITWGLRYFCGPRGLPGGFQHGFPVGVVTGHHPFLDIRDDGFQVCDGFRKLSSTFRMHGIRCSHLRDVPRFSSPHFVDLIFYPRRALFFPCCTVVQESTSIVSA